MEINCACGSAGNESPSGGYHRTALAAITCGVAFLLALFRQFGLVEVAASLAVGVEVFFLSSSIGDLLEDAQEPNRRRFLAALSLAGAVVAYFLIMRFTSSEGV